MSSTTKLRFRSDPTHYPIEDDVGERSLQRFIAELLRPLVERWLSERGVRAFVGADQFVYYEQFNPKKCVSPDVYVVPGVEPGGDIGCWKTWIAGQVPSFALEIVTGDPDKDYLQNPGRYADMGVDELVLFDPQEGPERLRFQVFRRLPRRGFVRVTATRSDRVRSRVLGGWIRAVGLREKARLRLGTGPRGDELFPIDAERAEEASRNALEASTRALAAEKRAARAEAELHALREELARREKH